MTTDRLNSGAARWLLQSGRCFVAHANCLFMRHGCRLHCAALAPCGQLRLGLFQANWPTGCGAASSGQPPSSEPPGLFDERRAAPTFPFPDGAIAA